MNTPLGRMSLWIGLVGLAALTLGCWRTPPDVPSEPTAITAGEPKEPEGLAEQVQTFCATCHAYPPPDSFPRRHWKTEVERAYRFFDESNLAVASPPLADVVRYYEKRAPQDYPPAVHDKPTRPLDLQFEPISYTGPPAEKSYAISNVNLVRLTDPGKLDVLATDMRNGLVMLLRPTEPQPRWRILGRVPHPARTEVVDLDGDGILDVLVADLGNFLPTDKRAGQVVWLRGRPDGTYEPHTLLDKVGRVADVRAADFRGNGKLDLIVAVFGWQHTGEILYLENQTTDWKRPKFATRVLDNRHGTIHLPVADLNGDGKPDFVALISQEHETIVAFLNEGGGKFRQQTLYSAPHPGYGSSGIELVDLDGDGRLDVLYTNGDVLDQPYLFKPFHSVQCLKNLGQLRFEHRPLTPMYGVHRAVAADFRGDGTKGIAAVSFLPPEGFPKRAERQADAVVLLDPVGSGKFDRHSLAKVQADHVSCAAGDVYGSGRADLVVGHFTGAGKTPAVTIWRNLGVKSR